MRSVRSGVFPVMVAAALFAGCEGGIELPSAADTTEPVVPAPGEAPATPGEDALRPVDPAANLKRFKSEAELEAYLKDQLASVEPVEYLSWSWLLPMPMIDIMLPPVFLNAAVTFDAAAPAAGTVDAAGGGYTTTNIQEAGVDESDVVKTDGTHFYVAIGSEVKIVRAVPAEGMVVLGSIPVQGRVDSMYLYRNPGPGSGKGRGSGAPAAPSDDLLVVLYGHNPYSGGAAQAGIPEGRNHPRTGVMLVDVADPAAPAVLREWLFEGGLQTSRLTGGRLHLVQRFSPSLSGMRRWYNGTEEDRAAAEAENRAAVDGLALDEIIPACYDIDGEGAVAAAGRLIEPVDFWRPDDPDGRAIVTVVTIDLTDLSSGFRSLAAVADVDTVYASTRSLYLTHTITSHTEDPQPPPLTGYDYSLQTVIRKFDLTAARVKNCASGRVWGRVLNQFSLGEHEGVLRIATTTGFRWGTGERAWRNHVFCVAERKGARLEIAGSVENIAPGEEIYAARFLGERGFLVTFRRIDPLFTLDLSDPANPAVVGELEVPGYSEYIHPFGENHLLTIGKESWSVCLSVFDVTDFANPALLHRELVGETWSDSEALRTHKAFTFWAERDLLAVPVSLNESGTGGPGGTSGWSRFTGLYVYRVTVEGGFEHLGRIDTKPSGSAYYYGPLAWTRGVFMGEDVYAVTPEAVKAAATADVGQPGGDVWSVDLAGE